MPTLTVESKQPVLLPENTQLLLVDDDPDLTRLLTGYFLQLGVRIESAATGSQAREALRQGRFDLVLLDLGLPDGSGQVLLSEIVAANPELPVIVSTGVNEADTARECLRAGACDYVTKPFLLAEVHSAVRRECRRTALRRRARLLDEAQGVKGLQRLIGDSAAMRAVRARLAKAAPKDIGVLISGETGSGKDVAALALHEASARSERPFLALDCGALPDRLIESELFGYERGAFTGADTRKRGRLELAEGGTLFLDEIGNLSPGLQAKLLRVLQERRFRRLGAGEDRAMDVRVLAATNADLDAARASGLFRDDLYYRLAELHVVLPPLRQRGEDLMQLFHVLLEREAAGFGRDVPELAPDVEPALRAHAWPGNVRELRHTIRRALLLAGRRIEAEDLGFGNLGPGAGEPAGPLEPRLRAALSEMESVMIQRALNQCHWVRQDAAAALAVDVKTLYNKMKAHGLA